MLSVNCIFDVLQLKNCENLNLFYMFRNNVFETQSKIFIIVKTFDHENCGQLIS